MVSRRTFVGALSAGAAAAYVRSAFGAPVAKGDAATDHTKWVKIFVGTGGHGHTFPGATVPFGAVQLSPDTGASDWDHCSGYHYGDSSILGFSHTHLSGTGCIDMLDVLLMPATDDFKFDPMAGIDAKTSYRSKFSHESEVAVPGYYKVHLDDSKVTAELTATERTGMHRYTFPQSDKSCFLLDMMHTDPHQKDPVRWASLKVVGNDSIVGARQMDVWGKGRKIHFSMKFSKPFTSIDFYSDGALVDDGSKEVKGKALRAVVHFKTRASEVVLVKTGISGVSIEGAEANLKAEAPAWDFNGMRTAAHAAWKQALNRVDIAGGDEKYLEIFYTGMYHMMVAPTLFDDVDGKYRGMDDKVHQMAKGEHNYSTFSLWDTYRALHPMYTLMMPEKVPALVNCLIRMSNESPEGVPIWPLQGAETLCMDGYHSAPVVAEAIAKGFPGIDAKAAYAPFRKRALDDDYRGLGGYRKYGYVPCDVSDESGSKTMDYAYDDRAVAALAKAAGETGDHDLLMKQSKNFVNLYDKETGFIRPRYADGHWAGKPFNPKSINVSGKWKDYTEANAWQTTFLVQHDIPLLIETMGGREAFLAKLDGLFSASSDMPPDMPPDVAGLVGQYAHGNEPSHHIAYMYNYAGAPEKTQSRVRSLLETMYDNKPDGMAGNEDCGQMSAWFCMSALGLYAVDPVSAMYDFGTPLFDKVSVSVGEGTKLVVVAKRESAKSMYIHGVTWNGTAHEGLQIAHADISKGGTLVFQLGDTPKKA